MTASDFILQQERAIQAIREELRAAAKRQLETSVSLATAIMAGGFVSALVLGLVALAACRRRRDAGR